MWRALLPGSDPKLKDEYVVLSAHLDHVGVGKPINGDTIYNGAMDDASGIATILEVARMMKESDCTRSVRSLSGRHGRGERPAGIEVFRHSSHRERARQIVADINLDMFLPLHPLEYLEVQGLAESTLGDDIRAVAEKAGSRSRPIRNRNGTCLSAAISTALSGREFRHWPSNSGMCPVRLKKSCIRTG